jgi:hypothetical protein
VLRERSGSVLRLVNGDREEGPHDRSNSGQRSG